MALHAGPGMLEQSPGPAAGARRGAAVGALNVRVDDEDDPLDLATGSVVGVGVGVGDGVGGATNGVGVTTTP